MKLLLLLLLATGLLSAVASQKQKSSALIDQPIYCSSTFSDEEWTMQTQKHESIMKKLHNTLKINTDHFVLNIVKHFDSKPNEFLKTVEAFKQEIVEESLNYFAPPAAIMLFFSLIYLVKICKRPAPQKDQQKPKKYELEQSSQIAMACMILISLLVSAISIYGLNQSTNIGLGLNQFACRILAQPNTFMRNSTSSGLTWFSSELEKFEVELDVQNEKFKQMVRSQAFRQQLREIVQKHVAKKNVDNNSSSIDKINRDLIQGISNISANSTKFQIAINRYNTTVEYIRQIIDAYQVILINANKFAQKYASPEDLILLSSTIFKTIYFIFILSSVGSLAFIIYTAVYSNFYSRSIKSNFICLLVFCLLISMTVSLACIVVVPSLYYFSQITTRFEANHTLLKKELQDTYSLNGQILEIILKFHPNSDGHIYNLFRGAVVADCELLSQELTLFLNNYSSAVQYAKSTDTNMTENSKDIVSVPLEVVNIFKESEEGIKGLLAYMDPIKGKMQHLDSSAFGKSLWKVVNTMRIPMLNSAYEHKWLLGYCSIGFSFALLCAIFIEPAKDSDAISIKAKEQDSQILLTNLGATK